MVPSGPAMRCSSSWMISSGGGRGFGEPRSRPRLGRPVESVGPMTVGAAQQHPRGSDPRQRRELVDRRDQEGGQPPVEGLVHRHHRQRPVAREGALEAGADETERAGVVPVRIVGSPNQPTEPLL